MALKRFTPEPLIFPMPNGTDYEVPPVDIDRGWLLSELLGLSQAQLKKRPENNVDLFRLAMTSEVWDRMATDGVPHLLAWRAGMASLAHYQVLNSASGDIASAHQAAMTTVEAIWESGIDPKAIGGWVKAKTGLSPEDWANATPSPSMAADDASTASTSGTSSPTKRATASRSRTRSPKKT